MTKRYFLNLDVDGATRKQYDYFLSELSGLFKYTFVAHTTRSHTAGKPKFRVYLRLKRPVDEVRFVAISRIMASMLFATVAESMDAVDEVSFRIAQLMYLPSVSKDQEFWSHANEGEILDAKKFLSEEVDYDWRDYTLLPYSEKRTKKRLSERGARMEDPTTKRGIIGVFCRTYDIEDAIAEFLSDVYEPSFAPGSDVRYNYIPGSGSNGAIVYDGGLFLYSQHGTDPIGEQLCNSFDMVRIHKFGHLDEGKPENTSPTNLPSYIAMVEYLQDDAEVMAELAASNVSSMAFEEVDDDEDDEDDEDDGDDLGPETASDPDDDDLLGPEVPEETGELEFEVVDDDDQPAAKKKKKPKKKPNREWVSRLTYDKNGNLERTRNNVSLICCNDVRITRAIARNELSGGPSLLQPLKFPEIGFWQDMIDDPSVGRKWTDNDTAALMWAFSAPLSAGGYGLEVTAQDANAAMLQASCRNTYNPVLNKITHVEWDGVERIETFFIDWLGTADHVYYRELALAWFTAGIARLHEPGHKFDLVPILGGKEGGGKSGLLAALGLGFAGALSGDYGNLQKMVESIRNKWILEVPELKGFHLGMLEDIKQWFSTTMDTVRLAYRQNEEDFPRRCIFAGTTNEGQYLRDPHGNRRFCPVPTDKHRGNMIDFTNLLPLIPQFWAEAQVRFLQMREDQPVGVLPLDLVSPEAIAEHNRLQAESSIDPTYEPVRQVIQAWADKEMLFEDDEGLDVEEDSRPYVRNLLTATIVQQALEKEPVFRGLRGLHTIIGQALGKLEGWTSLGKVRRDRRQARWYGRIGPGEEPDAPLWIPADEIDPDWDLLQ